MEQLEYTLCPPSRMPNKRKTKAKVFACSLLALTGCCGSTEACETNDHTFYLPINILLDSSLKSNYEQSESHPERDHMLARLSEFLNQLNTENWDEYGAHPIERRSYDNAVLIVNNTPEEVLVLWHVFPSPNGTISFEFKEREIAAMSVGNTDFSYVARRRKDRKAVKGKMAFDWKAASEALSIMSKHLEYL